MAVDQLTSTFAALADPTRRAILTRLAEGEATVNELAEPFPISVQAVSKHLKVLERAGLITRGRSAQLRPVPPPGRSAEGGRRLAPAVPRLLARRLRPPRRAPAWLSSGITIIRVFDAPRERVWREWIEPQRFADWFGGADAEIPLSTVSMDVRPGGSWRLTMLAGRPPAIHWTGEYREVVEPERLVFTLSDQPGKDAYELVTVVLTDLGDGRTEMLFEQRGQPLGRAVRAAPSGWASFFDRIAERLAGG